MCISYVYLIRNEKKELYIGYTSNLRRRIDEHNSGNTVSTRGHQWELIYYEAYKNEKDARNRERTLKRSGGGRRYLKERLINTLSE